MDLDKVITYHAKDVYPEECCGVVIEDGTYIRINNVAEDPLLSFEFDKVQYTKVLLDENIKYIVHSHPDGSSEPSEHDIKACNFLGIPYMIVSFPDVDITIVEPGDLNV